MSRACLQTHTPRAKDEISGACSSATLRSGQTSQEETAARLKRRRACLELGQRKEDFELLELLGQGSYARVYKARSRHSTRQVRSTTVYQTLPLHSSTTAWSFPMPPRKCAVSRYSCTGPVPPADHTFSSSRSHALTRRVHHTRRWQ